MLLVAFCVAHQCVAFDVRLLSTMVAAFLLHTLYTMRFYTKLGSETISDDDGDREERIKKFAEIRKYFHFDPLGLLATAVWRQVKKYRCRCRCRMQWCKSNHDREDSPQKTDPSDKLITSLPPTTNRSPSKARATHSGPYKRRRQKMLQ